MYPTDPTELSQRERDALQRLPREREPSSVLEERTVRALRTEGFLRRSKGRKHTGWIAAGLAAAMALFVGGMVVGQWLGTRTTVEALVAVEESNAREVAALVQYTGSAYAAALAALTDVPASADTQWVAQGREVALTSLYAVADRMVQLAPDDPLVARILQVVDGGSGSERPGSRPAIARQLVWF